MRRFLYGFGIIAIVVVLVLLGYWFRYRANQTGTTSSNNSAVSGSLPSDRASSNQQGGNRANANQVVGQETEIPDEGVAASPTQFGTISDKKVAAFSVKGNGPVTFIQTDGQIIQSDKGSLTTISSAPVADMLRASFSPDGAKILVLLNGGKQSSVFDIQTKTWELLPDAIEGAIWAPTGETLAYFVQAGNSKKQIYQLDLAAKKKSPKTIASLSIEDISLQWVSSKTLLIFEKSNAATLDRAWTFDVAKNVLTPVGSGEYGLSMLWDGDQQSLVFSSSQNGRGGTLTLRNGLGAIQKVFSFTTLPSKCVFGDLFASTSSASGKNTEVVCAIPKDQELFNRQTLPDSYEKRALFTSDGLFSINLSSGNIQTLRDVSEDDFDAQQLTISGSSLYFINRLDEKLYRLMATTSTAQ